MPTGTRRRVPPLPSIRHPHLVFDGGCRVASAFDADVFGTTADSMQAHGDPAPYSGHSLRAGFATKAARRGKADRTIMKRTRHKSVRTLYGYVRDGRPSYDNTSAGIRR